MISTTTTTTMTQRQRYTDFTQIAQNLYQGSAPPPGHLPFDLIVLCAREYQPPAGAFPGSRVLHVPMEDEDTVPVARAKRAAQIVTWALAANKRVLVTCQMGLNRSGLVVALAIVLRLGWSGRRAVQHVQRLRPYALCNAAFAEYVANLPARGT